MSSLAHRALGGATATVIGQGLRIAVLLVSFVVLARLLAPEDFGLIAMVVSLIGIGELLRDFGLSVASLQSKTLTDDEKSNLFWLNVGIGAVLTATVLAASWPIARLYDDERLVAITQVLSVTFLLNGIAAQFKVQINRDLRFVALGVTDVVPQLVGLGVAVVVAVVTRSYWALVTQVLVATVGGTVLSCVLARWRPGRYRRRVPIGRFVRFAGALVGTQSLAYLPKNVDSVLLGVVGGPAQVGMYNRAYQVVVLPLNQIAAPLSRVAIPVLSRIQDDAKVFMRYLGTAQFATVTVASVCYGSVIGLGEPLVLTLLGDEWRAAAPILRVLALSGIFRALGQLPYWVFVSLGETGRQLQLYLIGQPLIIVAIAAGTPWGAIGIAAGCSAGYAAFWVINMWWARRVTGLPLGALAWSGAVLVALFAAPVAALGAVAVHLSHTHVGALGLGALATCLWVAVVLGGVPRCRAEVDRLVRLARHRPL